MPLPICLRTTKDSIQRYISPTLRQYLVKPAEHTNASTAVTQSTNRPPRVLPRRIRPKAQVRLQVHHEAALCHVTLGCRCTAQQEQLRQQRHAFGKPVLCRYTRKTA